MSLNGNAYMYVDAQDAYCYINLTYNMQQQVARNRLAF